jgi:excisionase family DNA binding protein
MKPSKISKPSRPLNPPLSCEELSDWVSPAEAARLLRCGKTTIYDLCARKLLPSERFGRLVRIPKRALLPPDGDETITW